MTDRSKLLALAEAVEKLTGPSVEIDTEIARTVYADNCRNPDWECGPVLAYTASLDAAMTLVPNGFGSLISGKYPDGRVGYVAVATHPARAEAEGLTKATAFTAAALRAQAEALA